MDWVPRPSSGPHYAISSIPSFFSRWKLCTDAWLPTTVFKLNAFRTENCCITCHFPLFLAHILTLAAILGLGKKNSAKTRFQRDVEQDGRVERGDLSSVVSDRAMNPHWVSLNFQSLF